MHVQNQSQAGNFIQFPPIPLVSGAFARNQDGEACEVTAVAVVACLANGDTVTVQLEYKFGGWWQPAAGGTLG